MNKKNYSIRTIVLALLGALSWFQTDVVLAANPYLPLWEYIPDGEPYVFEDPDHPGKYRVYVYGSHDSMKTEYCGREQVVWSAPVDDLNNWRYDGIIFESKTDARGEWLNAGGVGDVLYAPDVVEVKDKTGRRRIISIRTIRQADATAWWPRQTVLTVLSGYATGVKSRPKRQLACWLSTLR